MKKLILVWVLVLVATPVAMFMAFKPGYGFGMLKTTLISVEMDTMPAVSYRTPQGYGHLTEGLRTSVDYRVQQFAMQTVLVDVDNVNPRCSGMAQRGYHGIAVSAERLVCIDRELWLDSSAYSYYVLSHELAHIALGDFGRAQGTTAWHHRPEHFDLTVVIMERMMRDNGVHPLKADLIILAIELARDRCADAAIC